MLDLVTPAFAQSSAAGSGAMISNVVFMLLLFGIFYFLLIRPQQKQTKMHQQMLDNLQRDDSVVTNGGLLGRIHRIDDDVIILEVGEVEVAPRQPKPVRVRVRKASISAVTAKTAPTPALTETKSESK